MWLLYESTYHLLVKDLVSDGNSYFAYERIIKQNSYNAVVTIPIYQCKFVLLNQFRHSMRDYRNVLCKKRFNKDEWHNGWVWIINDYI